MIVCNAGIDGPSGVPDYLQGRGPAVVDADVKRIRLVPPYRVPVPDDLYTESDEEVIQLHLELHWVTLKIDGDKAWREYIGVSLYEAIVSYDLHFTVSLKNKLV